MPRILTALLVLLAGCGSLDAGTFKTDYAARYCALTLECGDPAVLAFDGIVDEQTCLATIGPEVDAWGRDCKLKKRNAKRCLDAMDALVCPGEGTTLDELVPFECDEAFKKCDGAALDPTETDDTAS